MMTAVVSPLGTEGAGKTTTTATPPPLPPPWSYRRAVMPMALRIRHER